MYDPKRLRLLIERVGPPAHSLADIPLRYWQPKSNPFPHADRDCKYLRTKTPVAAIYTLSDMTSEGWCCHECGVEPPNRDLVKLLELFEEIEALCDVVIVLRTSTSLDDPVTRVHHAYRHVVKAMSLARHSYPTVLRQYAQNVVDGCVRDLADCRRAWGRNTLDARSKDLRRVAADARGVIYSDTEKAFSDLDWMILERGSPRRGDLTEAELIVPTSLVTAGRYRELVDLGVAAAPIDKARRPDTRQPGGRSGSSSRSTHRPGRRL